eukprot:scaffold32268_cov58-Phaeocystis_antarctica.AAC.4
MRPNPTPPKGASWGDDADHFVAATSPVLRGAPAGQPSGTRAGRCRAAAAARSCRLCARGAAPPV